jgi:hypothetical protein
MYHTDLLGSGGYTRIDAFVCLLCGEIVDRMIMINRTNGAARAVILPRKGARRVGRPRKTEMVKPLGISGRRYGRHSNHP